MFQDVDSATHRQNPVSWRTKEQKPVDDYYIVHTKISSGEIGLLLLSPTERGSIPSVMQSFRTAAKGRHKNFMDRGSDIVREISDFLSNLVRLMAGEDVREGFFSDTGSAK